MKITKLKPYFFPVAIGFAILAIFDFAAEQPHVGRGVFNVCVAVLQFALYFKTRGTPESPPT